MFFKYIIGLDDKDGLREVEQDYTHERCGGWNIEWGTEQVAKQYYIQFCSANVILAATRANGLHGYEPGFSGCKTLLQL